MLKGQVEEITYTIAVIMVVAAFTLIFFLLVGMVAVAARVGTVKQDMEAVDLAHLYYSCISKDGVIEESFLEGRGGAQAGDCGLAAASWSVKDLESGKEWKAGGIGGGRGHRIFVPVKTADGIHAGEMIVKKSNLQYPDIKR
ncbi:MAG: hypothetical protein HY518_05570 [Candidatus Aenigmarchaeota archaeon]|nr:hypothetical protein [Candidatus Aenigmarchaeota archaeon]